MSKHFQFDPTEVFFSPHEGERLTRFDLLLRAEWDRALSQGLFTFEINGTLKQRILDDGDLEYLIELNSDRFTKRRKPEPFERVNTPFDSNRFNFNRIRDEEILFSLDNDEQKDQHLVIINNSPIRPYHVLLVPNRQLEMPQVMTIDALRFGFEFLVSSAHPYVCTGYNSLCGYASVNHLHFHGLFMPRRLFIQTIKCSPFHPASHCFLHDISDAEAFAFEVKSVADFPSIARSIDLIVKYLVGENIAHNLMLMKGDSFSSTGPAVRIFLWFRQSNIGAKYSDRCNVACLELAGFMFLPYENVFNELTEKELRQHLNAAALPAEQRDKIKNDVKKLLDEEKNAAISICE